MIYHSYYIIGNKDDVSQFLTEDRSFTSTLNRALNFPTKEDAQDLINAYKENEKDDYFTGDYYISGKLEVRNVSIKISNQLK